MEREEDRGMKNGHPGYTKTEYILQRKEKDVLYKEEKVELTTDR
jgi:hypothetical protein